MPKKKINKNKLSNWLDNSENQKKIKLFVLFVFGFLIGLMFKSQSTKTIVNGFEDYKALNSDKVEIQEVIM